MSSELPRGFLEGNRPGSLFVDHRRCPELEAIGKSLGDSQVSFGPNQQFSGIPEPRQLPKSSPRQGYGC